jgi:hypothetical protein
MLIYSRNDKRRTTLSHDWGEGEFKRCLQAICANKLLLNEASLTRNVMKTHGRREQQIGLAGDLLSTMYISNTLTSSSQSKGMPFLYKRNKFIFHAPLYSKIAVTEINGITVIRL